MKMPSVRSAYAGDRDGFAVQAERPFDRRDQEGLPVLLCENCMEYALEDRVMATVDHIFDSADDASELRVVKYAA